MSESPRLPRRLSAQAPVWEPVSDSDSYSTDDSSASSKSCIFDSGNCSVGELTAITALRAFHRALNRDGTAVDPTTVELCNHARIVILPTEFTEDRPIVSAPQQIKMIASTKETKEEIETPPTFPKNDNSKFNQSVSKSKEIAPHKDTNPWANEDW